MPRSPRHMFGLDGRGRHGPGMGGRDHRGRRTLDAAELRLILLKLLAEQPRHGYELMRDIETRTAGAYVPSPGMVYPALTMLDEMGQIEATTSDGAKRMFTLTDAGRAALEQAAAEADAALARLDRMRAAAPPPEAASIWRAMQNLGAVLQQRIGPEADRARMQDVAEAIDDAARRIERL